MNRILILFLVVSNFTYAQSSNSDQKSKEGIVSHVRAIMTKNGEYNALNFDDLVTHKPVLFNELEELIALKETLPTLKQRYSRKKLDSLIVANDTAIQIKKREIMAQKAHYSYEREHTFMIKNSKNHYTAYRYVFFLNHTFQVKDVTLLFKIELEDNQAEDFNLFQKRIPIHKNRTPSQNAQASYLIYSFFEDGLAEHDYDPLILSSAIQVVMNIRENDYLDMDKLGETAIDKWIETNRPNIEKYKSKDYSYMLELKNEAGTLIGYRMYHLYSYQNQGELEKDVISFNFDKYFVIRSLERIGPPFDIYFEKN